MLARTTLKRYLASTAGVLSVVSAPTGLAGTNSRPNLNKEPAKQLIISKESLGQSLLSSIKEQLPLLAQDTFAQLTTKKFKEEQLVLLDKSADGSSTAENLLRLIQSDWEERLNPWRPYILVTLIDELSDPYLIMQGRRRTCSVACIQYALFKHNPSEAVRLLSGLLGQSHSVSLRGGAILELPSDALDPDNSQRYSPVDRILQSAFMEFTNGPEKFYSNFKDLNINPQDPADPLNFGADPTGIKKLINQIFSKAFIYRRYNSDVNIVDLKKAFAQGPVILFMDWGRLMDYEGEDGSKETFYASHAVNLEAVTDKGVIIRNPWGRKGYLSIDDGPKRKIVDKEKGLELIQFDVLKKRLWGAVLPAGK